MTVARRAGSAPMPVGAVVIGGDYQGLGIVRSLGRRGIPVCVLDDEQSIARASRYRRGWVGVRSLRREHDALDAILDLGREARVSGWVLFPTRDETVALISRNRALLAQTFRVPTPAWETIQPLWDKRETYRLAHGLGIPTPKTWTPGTVAELEAIPGDGPWAIKPAIKERFFYQTHAKAWRADTRADLARLFARAAALIDPTEVMVQELIPGDGGTQLAYCAFFARGTSLATMTTRRLRQHPPEFGRASTYVVTIEAPALRDLGDRFLRAVGYYGLVEMEFKLDQRDGRPKLLDVNARTWGYHSLGAAAGVDFSWILYRDQVGESVAPVRARSGVRWIRVVTDVPTAVVEIAHARLALAPYLRSLARADVDAVFCRDDPLPGLFELALLPYLAVRRGF